MNKKIVLEKAAKIVAEQSSIPPLIFELPFEKGREALEKAQKMTIYKYPVNIEARYYNTSHGYVKTFIVTPKCCKNIENIIFYIHGAGWVFGSFHTHEKLVRELCYRTNSIVIFPEYTRSPEAKFPIAIEQCYEILSIVRNIVKCRNVDFKNTRLIVSGDSVGGNMAIAMAFMSNEKCNINIDKLLLYYPVTNDDFNTNSYNEFGEGFYLYREGMKWFWNQYEPDIEKRKSILATPLNADINELKNMPQTLIINGEADVLRDEGEEFANKLREAGNNITAVRFQGIIHDFVMLNSLDKTNACRAAMDLSTSWINRKN